MNTNYPLLTEIRITHGYSDRKPFTGLTVKATQATQTALLNQGLLLKTGPGRVALFFHSQLAGEERTWDDMVKEKIILDFMLILQAPAFLNYTADLPADLSKSVLYLSNEGRIPASTTLHAAAEVGTADFRPVREWENGFFNKPFGMLRLVIDERLQPQYHVRFRAQSTYWCYIVVSDHLKALSKPAVIHPASGARFTGPDRLLLPDHREAMAFRSPEPITLTASPADFFQLVEDFESMQEKYKVIIKALPVPDTNVLSVADTGKTKETGKHYSEIFLY